MSEELEISVFDLINDRIPEYYDTMYMDGYTPTEIMFAVHKKMKREYQERQKVDSIKITSEVKIR